MMTLTEHSTQNSDQQKQRAKRTAILLALIAVGVYFGFIIATGMKS
jgi:hypothetical protein